MGRSRGHELARSLFGRIGDVIFDGHGSETHTFQANGIDSASEDSEDERKVIKVRVLSTPCEYLGGACVRVRCMGGSREEFDLRCLRLSAQGGGFVALEALESIEREVTMMAQLTPHCHVVYLRAGPLTMNKGGEHSRLLLHDPCVADLSNYVLEANYYNGALPPIEVADLGQQLAFGLGHLHSLGFLYGMLNPLSILRGRDGFWKLGSFVYMLPMQGLLLADWCKHVRQVQTVQSQREKGVERVRDNANAHMCSDHAQGFIEARLPPEVSAGELHASRALDVWFLGRLLAVLLLGSQLEAVEALAYGPQCAAGLAAAGSFAQQLNDLAFTKLLLLVFWMSVDRPTERPCLKSVAILFGSVRDVSCQELVEELPSSARARCRCLLMAAGFHGANSEGLQALSAALESNDTSNEHADHKVLATEVRGQANIDHGYELTSSFHGDASSTGASTDMYDREVDDLSVESSDVSPRSGD